MPDPEWLDVGSAEALRAAPVTAVQAGKVRLAIVSRNGALTAISGACNHVGGPLGEGTLEGDYVVCPWHHWKFHRETGAGEPGFEEDRVPAYALKVEGGRVLVDLASATPRRRRPHPPHPLARPPEPHEGPIRVAGISTTVMNREFPRYSTSDALLATALAHAAAGGCETRELRLRDLAFRHCEGYYSKSARACTWPCSITQMDPGDQLDQVYEAFVHWADVLVVATPIRWGNPSSLYFKMVERMNCIQNQETIAGRHLVKNKVVAFVVTGGQDNVQGVVGGMMSFFAELGCQFPQFPFVAHSRGWTAEDMENNVREVREGAALHEGARALVDRSIEMARVIRAGRIGLAAAPHGGRKAQGPG